MTPVRSVLAAALALAAAPAFAQDHTYSQTVFFGDSLTDSGHFRPALVQAVGPSGALLGRFTTNPGLVWAEYVADYYGTNAASDNQGGTNYAVGGARTGTNTRRRRSAPIPSLTHADHHLPRPPTAAAPTPTRCTPCGAAPTTCSPRPPLPAQAQAIIGAARHRAGRQRRRAAERRRPLHPGADRAGPGPDSAVPRAGRRRAGAGHARWRPPTTTRCSAAWPRPACASSRSTPSTCCRKSSPTRRRTASPTSPARPAHPQITGGRLVADLQPGHLRRAGRAGHLRLRRRRASVVAGARDPGRLRGVDARSARARSRCCRIREADGRPRARRPRRRADRHASGRRRHALVGRRARRLRSATATATTTTASARRSASASTGPAATSCTAASPATASRRWTGAATAASSTRTTPPSAASSAGTGGSAWVNGQVSYTLDLLRRRSPRASSARPRAPTAARRTAPTSAPALNAGWNFGDGSLKHGPVRAACCRRRSKSTATTRTAPKPTALAFPDQDFDSLIGSVGWQVDYAINEHLEPYAQLTYDHEFEDDDDEAFAQLRSMPGTAPYAVPGVELRPQLRHADDRCAHAAVRPGHRHRHQRSRSARRAATTRRCSSASAAASEIGDR